ncbi:MAG: acetylglutamate kinase [Eubacteriales bacterium]
MIDNKAKAQVLVDALPYLQKYNNKIVVVKYGGNAMTSEDLKSTVMCDVVLLSLVGIKVVLVHGGGPEINEQLAKINKKPEFVDGIRYTDKETMEVVQMVLCGKINKNLVSLLGEKGGKAIGLSGLDASMLVAKQKSEALGYVGEITQVNTDCILDALDKGYIPVISSVAMGEDSQVYNINADTAAAKIAAALHAENLILMTDISGLLRDVKDPSSLLSMVTLDEVEQLKAEGVITGGMIPKVDCCVDAVTQGLDRSIIIDGRIPHAILIEMLSEEGIGTMFHWGKTKKKNLLQGYL